MDSLVETLNKLLSESYTLSLKAQGYHWNVEGPMFPMYHEFFGNYYEDVYGQVDKIAEEIRAIDGRPTASLIKMVDMSSVKENEAPGPATAMVRELSMDNAKILTTLNNAFNLATSANQQGLANYISERQDAHQKHAWMFRSMLKSTDQTNESVEEEQSQVYEIVFNK